ncbi:hypothetical protein DFH08DRAFT_1030737 [Mycena albidolilacea]|uniref:Uncharacterized protein n=1 Tax=Mycena albidolilacea TaxID=1033008 RepID=A0AAD6ZHW1_9AGAR|nr:hypothetical protein DFH08DRAFT_1030737 [Mycena albidolilacea]
MALSDAQTSSRCPKHSEGISLYSIQGETATIWWLPPQCLPFSVKELKIIRRIEYLKCYIPSTNYHLGLFKFRLWCRAPLPFKINYPAHNCAIQHPQNPFQFLGFRRLRGQLNPALPCILDVLFVPWQPVKPIPLESELWCWKDPRPLPQYFRFREGPRARCTYAADVPWPPPPGFERQYKMNYSNQ